MIKILKYIAGLVRKKFNMRPGGKVEKCAEQENQRAYSTDDNHHLIERWHVNPISGAVGKCMNQPGNCPFGEHNHYSTEQAAQIAVDKLNEAKATQVQLIKEKFEKNNNSITIDNFELILCDFKSKKMKDVPDDFKVQLKNENKRYGIINTLAPPDLNTDNDYNDWYTVKTFIRRETYETRKYRQFDMFSFGATKEEAIKNSLDCGRSITSVLLERVTGD
ncbi:MAG: hypothetical protein FWE83_06425 [Oscillospiraceae bacterium]|nr:hypothetical protein [Oscillospiraceae bacterium]